MEEIILISANKGEENVPGMIFVIGGIIVTVLTVGLGMSLFGVVDLPDDSTKAPSRNIHTKIAGYADKCWEKSGKGSDLGKKDCFSLRINGTEDISKNVVKERLRILPRERLGFGPEFREDSLVELQVSYLPSTKTVNITLLRDLPGS